MDDLQSFNQALGSNWPIFTEEMRYTDRVLAFDGNYLRFYLREPPPALNSSIYSMITGNVGNAIHFPLNAVRWLTDPENIAVFVTESQRSSFSARIYQFGEDPRPMGVEFYLLQPGTYQVSLVEQESGESVPAPDRLEVSGKSAGLRIEVPSRRTCTLSLVKLSARSDRIRGHYGLLREGPS